MQAAGCIEKLNFPLGIPLVTVKKSAASRRFVYTLKKTYKLQITTEWED